MVGARTSYDADPGQVSRDLDTLSAVLGVAYSPTSRPCIKVLGLVKDASYAVEGTVEEDKVQYM